MTSNTQCSRTLPTCAQCTSSGASCRYPNSNKRGIPTGYIAVLEKRLLETELALFESLCTLYRSQVPIEPYRSSLSQREAIADFSYKQSKSEKLEEWNRCSLGTDCDRLAWWQKKCEVSDLRVADAMVMASPSDGVGLEYQPPEPPDILVSEEAQIHDEPNVDTTSPIMLTLPPQANDTAPIGNTSIDEWRRYF